MRRHLALLLLAAIAMTTFVTAGCSSPDDTTTAGQDEVGTGAAPAPVTGTITVSAAASLTGPFTTIGEDFQDANPGATVRLNFDSSGTLASQIIDGAPADVFASADVANMDKLTDENLVAGNPAVFARNQLTIVVKKGNPGAIRSLADLPTAGTISLCGSEVPCGRYADQILADAGVTIPTEVVTRGQNVKATLTAVAEGDADAGIVYVTDATGDKVEAVVIPDAENAVATYPIAALKGSTESSTAEAFIAYVVGPQGQSILKAAGFLPPA